MFSRILPTPVLCLTALSGFICLPMFALSMVNFGLLSIWLNAAVAVFIIVHHIILCIVTWVSGTRNSSAKIIIDDEESSPIYTEDDMVPPTAYSLTNIGFLIFIFILNAIAFSIMVDITTRGALKSTLPAERVGHKWNIKIQMGQTSVLGAELLVLAAILTMCSLGRKAFIDAFERKKQELEY